MKVGDLVRMVCRHHKSEGTIGVIIAIHDCGSYSDEMIVLTESYLEEWEEDDIEVIDESR
jgi:hypothetical protein